MYMLHTDVYMYMYIYIAQEGVGIEGMVSLSEDADHGI